MQPLGHVIREWGIKNEERQTIAIRQVRQPARKEHALADDEVQGDHSIHMEQAVGATSQGWLDEWSNNRQRQQPNQK
jgi:hypothetical protein